MIAKTCRIGFCHTEQAEDCPNDCCDEHCRELCTKHERDTQTLPAVVFTRTRVTDFFHALGAFDGCLEVHEPHHRGAWRQKSVEEHLEHAAAHLEAWKKHRQYSDLVSLFVRCGMALEVFSFYGLSTLEMLSRQSVPPEA